MTLKVKDVDCQIVRTHRKTVGIYIERDGSVMLRAAIDTSDDQLVKVVKQKLTWIYRTQALWNEMNVHAPKRELVFGETFYLGGYACLLDIRNDVRKPLSLEGDRLVLSRTQVGRVDELMRAMYRKLGYEQLPELIGRYAP